MNKIIPISTGFDVSTISSIQEPHKPNTKDERFSLI